MGHCVSIGKCRGAVYIDTAGVFVGHTTKKVS